MISSGSPVLIARSKASERIGQPFFISGTWLAMKVRCHLPSRSPTIGATVSKASFCETTAGPSLEGTLAPVSLGIVVQLVAWVRMKACIAFCVSRSTTSSLTVCAAISRRSTSAATWSIAAGDQVGMICRSLTRPPSWSRVKNWPSLVPFASAPIGAMVSWNCATTASRTAPLSSVTFSKPSCWASARSVRCAGRLFSQAACQSTVETTSPITCSSSSR